jgi:predicted GNAT superfamily acetyltransferase
MQRRTALRAGVDCIQWTFDPLRAKNAYLNIARLGAVVRRYFPDCYGRVDSRLQKGLPTDRVIAEWWIKSPRVRRAIRGAPPPGPGKKPVATVEIPADIDSLRSSRPGEARACQQRVRVQLQEYFAQGLAATGFIYDGQSARYLLDRYEN